MIRIFDIMTGELTPNVPPRIPVFRVYVKGTDGHYADFVKPEDIDAYMDAHDVLDVWEDSMPDPAYVAARKEAFERAWSTSCIMPSEEDLLLLIAAKRCDPQDWESIDPDAGQWKETRQRLREIRHQKIDAAYGRAPDPYAVRRTGLRDIKQG